MARVNTSGPSKTGIQNSSYSYAADAQASDAYAITVSPAPSAYAAGQRWLFKANTANTGAASLNVNSLGAKTILKSTDQALVTGDIEVGSIVEVVYDGTNMQMVSVGAVAPGSGDVTGPAASIDSEMALFSGTGGKTIKRATLTGVVRMDSGVVSIDSDVTDIVAAGSESTAGKLELATAAETTTGTDATRAIHPDGFAGSDFGKRVVEIQVFDSATATAVGDGKAFFRIPSAMNGWNLVAVAMHVYTAGTTNTTDVQIRRTRSGSSVDMLSTKLTIDSTEVDTLTAAAAAAINASNDDVATGDKISVDVDAVSTTPAQGMCVELTFQLP